MQKISLCLHSLSVVIGLLVCMQAGATPAFKKAMLHLQSDGTTLNICLAGDEDFAYFKTDDDIPLWRNSAGDYCYLEFSSAGLPQAGSTIAHNLDERSEQEQAVALQSATALVASQTKQALLRGYSIGTQSGASVESTGEVSIPVLLIEFSDVSFAQESDSLGFVSDSLFFEDLFNSEDEISVRRYFLDQSDNQFDPTFSFIGPLQLSQTMAYYGQNNSSGNDKNYTEMIREAITLAIDEGYDLSQFATSGEVPFIAVVHAGESEEVSGESDHLWSRYLSSLDYTTGGIKFSSTLYVGERNDFGYGYEQQNGIGIFCHEFSHALGLPDMYTNTTVFGMDFWDLMDYGEFYQLANLPTGYTAYERDFMGWLPFDTLKQVKQAVKLEPLAGGEGVRSLVIVNPEDEDEYYVLSNLQSWTWFPSVLGYGMMINWIDYNASTWTNNRVNRTTSSLNITLLPADGERTYHSSHSSSYKGDLWPGYTDNTSLSSLTSPADSVHTGDFMGIQMSDIHIDDDLNIVFAFMAEGFLDEPGDLAVVEVGEAQIEIAWTAVENADCYKIEVTAGDETVIVDTVSTTGYTATGLSGDTEYTLSVTAINDDYIDSDATSVSATTIATSVNSLLLTAGKMEGELYTTSGSLIGRGTLTELKRHMKSGQVYLLRLEGGEAQKVRL